MKDKLKNRIEEVTELANTGHSYATASIILGVNRSAIRKFAIKHGITFLGKRDFIYNNIQTVNTITSMYQAGSTGDTIALLLGIDTKTVYKVLKDNNIKLESNNYKLRNNQRLNYDAFSDFKNDFKAPYFYGWLLTDGCISDNGSISIDLQYRDHEVLDELYKYIGLDKVANKSTSKLNDKTFPIARFSLRDKTVLQRLSAQGLSPRKSMKEDVPAFYDILHESSLYFWRGCIEGDGCICVKGKATSISLVGSEKLINKFIEYAEKVCKVTSIKKPYFIKNTSNLFSIRYNSLDAMLICEVIWNGTGLSLTRKEDTVKKLIEKVKNNRSRLATKFIYQNNGKFELRIRYDGKPIHLGMFNSLETAQSHRDEFLDLLDSYKHRK